MIERASQNGPVEHDSAQLERWCDTSFWDLPKLTGAPISRRPGRNDCTTRSSQQSRCVEISGWFRYSKLGSFLKWGIPKFSWGSIVSIPKCSNDLHDFGLPLRKTCSYPPKTAISSSESYGGFLKWGYPQVRWMVFFRENPIEMDDDWGYPYFRKPPYAPCFLRRFPMCFPAAALLFRLQHFRQVFPVARRVQCVRHVLNAAWWTCSMVLGQLHRIIPSLGQKTKIV